MKYCDEARIDLREGGRKLGFWKAAAIGFMVEKGFGNYAPI